MKPREYETMAAVEERHWWFVGLHHDVAHCLERFRPAQSRHPVRMLDAGCGTGGWLTYLARHAGVMGSRAVTPLWTVGLDLAWEGLQRADARRLPYLVQGSVNALPFQSHAFDVVTSLDVLYHQGVDDLRALQEAIRVLEPGGILVLQVPAFEWLRSEHDTAIATKRRYTRREIAALVEQAGLVVKHNRYRNSLLFPVLAVLRLLKRHRREAEDARSDVGRVPRVVNAWLQALLQLETWLAAHGVALPFGLSVFCVAERPRDTTLAAAPPEMATVGA